MQTTNVARAWRVRQALVLTTSVAALALAAGAAHAADPDSAAAAAGSAPANPDAARPDYGDRVSELVVQAAPATAPADYLLDLRAPAPPRVRSWLRVPAVLRAVGPSYDPASDASYLMSGGSLRGWFDVLVHQGLVTATTPL